MHLSDLHIDVSLVNLGFLAGLATICVVRLLTPVRWHTAIATVMSAALIGLASWPTLAMLTAVTFGIVLPLSGAISRCRVSAPQRAKRLLAVGVAAVILPWVVLKLNREVDLPWIHGSGLAAEMLRLVGVSYFIFRAIDVLYMHYLMGEVPDSGPMRAFFFAIFPPTLTSGPIQKYPEFCREAANPRPLDLPLLLEAAERITLGYFYKVCVGPVLQASADRLLAEGTLNVYESVALTASMYVFVFFDFAGYSHIAIGFGQLLGIRVPENFRQPFLATSITEFWRNWHISIGDWFRDHVFIPFGGMRLGGLRAAVFAAAIMLVCGLWHGFTLMFVAWGVWHASNIFFDGIVGTKPIPPAQRKGPRFWSRVLATNARIAFGAIFFLPSWAAARPVLEGFLKWW